jgi:5-methyltetrahydropteroyltriglutamate--homocysteine methyltransferase
LKRSESRILTTHTGSLPRSPEQQEFLRAREEQRDYDPQELEASARRAVFDIVKMQTETGLDVINDGEQGRAQYTTYVKDRLNGFEGERQFRNWDRLEDRDFPEWASTRPPSGTQMVPQPVCTGPISWRDFGAVQQDIDNIKAATAQTDQEEVFMTAASPGVIATFLRNEHVRDHRSLLIA